MSTRTVVEALDRVNTLAVDPDKTRWPYEELLGWYNDAVLAVVNLRPDANSKNAPFTLVPNSSKQTLPSDGLRWLDIVHDVATGNPIRRRDRRILDDQVPNWHKTTGPTVKSWVFDERDPKTAYVFPQPTTADSLQIVYSVAPTSVEITDFENDATTIGVDDSYFNAIVDYMLYRIYSKDADYAANGQRASAHYNAFLQAMGNKTSVDMEVSPSGGR